jgi:hypothetical protein
VYPLQTVGQLHLQLLSLVLVLLVWCCCWYVSPDQLLLLLSQGAHVV